MSLADYLVRFIEEDAPFGDATSDAIIPDVDCRAQIRAEQDGTIAGLEEAAALFAHYGIQAEAAKHDGDRVRNGDILLVLSGPAKKILLIERTALNIIGRMSGIATRTRQLADLVAAASPRCRIAGTRKTCPGLRALDKKAILLGGGDPHRSSLSDGILIKDNHLVLVPLEQAVRSARAVSAYRKIEVEVESSADAVAAARAGADILLLDNMKPEQVTETLHALISAGLREGVTVELSGGIDDTNIGKYASLGADLISLGALTHTVRNFSVTLEILPGSS